MALIGWILSLACLFGGLAMRQDMPIGGAQTLSTMLFVAAFLTFPVFWRARPLGISRGQRIVAVLIMLFCLPMVLLPTA